MKNNGLLLLAVAVLLLAAGRTEAASFVRVDGTRLSLDGEPFLIKGTNLSNWLLPEAYMFDLTEERVASRSRIDEMLRQLAGPRATDQFWNRYLSAYITEKDIAFLATCGVNTVRVPFSYRLFTDDDYMGTRTAEDGFALMDRLIGWCRQYGILLILDMHSAPGGQTGYNIDDSDGFPWLFYEKEDQETFFSVWESIAAHYAEETQILGYELLNEPIADYFGSLAQREMNARLEDLYKKATARIRRQDPDHIIILGGARWNLDFSMFNDFSFDHAIMYTCHRYGGTAGTGNIQEFLDFRTRSGCPMFMGELGHNSLQWQEKMASALEENGIGYTFWPYKKLGDECMVSIVTPKRWFRVKAFAAADRSSYEKINQARPGMDEAREALQGFLEGLDFDKCITNTAYIASMRLKVGGR